LIGTASIWAAGLGGSCGAEEGFVFRGEFFVENAESAEVGESLLGSGLVDLGDGEADVDDGVVADDDFRDVVEADVLDYASKVDAADADHAVGGDLFDFSGNGEAHSNLVIPLWPDGQCDLDHDARQAPRWTVNGGWWDGGRRA